jgi:peptide/nickel transport system substrate-binding protein
MGSAVRRGAMLLAALAAFGGCGDDDNVAGSITIAQTSQPDFLDPALSYTLNGWEPMWLVYTPLLTYRRAEGEAGTELIPGLAEDLPQISDDGTTYRLKLRPGLRYSSGRPVRASDFEHTIQRVLSLESAGSGFFLGIKGAPEYVKRNEPGSDISGIVTDDPAGSVTISLRAPDATFSYALATNFAGLVPGDTPFRNLTTDPPPGVGPYRIVRSVPNRDFAMERNRHFEVPGIPAGHVDRIVTRIIPNAAREAQDVIRGKLDYMQDAPPPDLLPEIRRRHGDRYREFVSPATSFFFLNTEEPPFDKLDVRRAVNFALDERALARLVGGLLEPTCNFIPPDVPGYRPLDPCPYGDPRRPPDLERARRLVRRAGAEGADVAVWGPQQRPGPQVAGYYADMLGRIGLHATTKLVDFAVYSQTVGDRKTKAQTGLSNWSGDFPHPSAFLRQFDGSAITDVGNVNLGNVRDPVIDESMARLNRQPDLASVEDRWAKVDRRLVERAYVAVYGHPKRATFLSERMDFEHCARTHPIYGNDYSSFCLK